MPRGPSAMWLQTGTSPAKGGGGQCPLAGRRAAGTGRGNTGAGKAGLGSHGAESAFGFMASRGCWARRRSAAPPVRDGRKARPGAEVAQRAGAEKCPMVKQKNDAMYSLRPRQFERLIAEILAHYEWDVHRRRCRPGPIRRGGRFAEPERGHDVGDNFIVHRGCPEVCCLEVQFRASRLPASPRMGQRIQATPWRQALYLR